MKFRKKDVYKKLAEPESDTDQSADDSDDQQQNQVYSQSDIKYNLVNPKDTEKEMPPNQRPMKGYYYMSFTIIMMIILIAAVLNDVRDAEDYINKRNK